MVGQCNVGWATNRSLSPSYLQYPAGESRVVLVVLPPEEVPHAKVLDEERRHLRRQLKRQRSTVKQVRSPSTRETKRSASKMNRGVLIMNVP